MFICEVKSITKSFAFELGDIEALEFRRRKLESALDQADDKADWLAARKCGDNYAIPEAIHALVPMVISPFTEYIWTTNSNLWLTEKIPRVCLASDVDQLTNDDALSEIVKRPFVKYVI
jgi:hypothetical protein